MEREARVEKAYEIAKEEYLEIGVDTDLALDRLDSTAISIHCWQTDDVSGCETPDAALSGGGIQATDNYPGKARNITEIRDDLEKVFSLIPGSHRLNLHAIYGDFQGEKIDRDMVEPEHFKSWTEWAKGLDIGMDFNSTLFSHPKSGSGYTLSSKDKTIRDFWIEHVKRCAL
jgi:L-rhamnose isomerase